MNMPRKKLSKIAKKRKPYLKQADVPGCSLDQALKVPKAIADNYASKPTTPLNVAAALDVQPTSGPFRMLTGAAMAYGLTEGGYNAKEISLTPLASRAVRPLADGDDLAARREAMLRPRVFREFLTKYDGSPLPREEIALNVLDQLGVPRERTQEVLDLLVESANSVGLIKVIKEKRYIDLAGTKLSTAGLESTSPDEGAIDEMPSLPVLTPRSGTTDAPSLQDDKRKRRVFVTHGKNVSFLEPIKKLLTFGELEAVISAEKQTVSQPVPEKVMADMRSCGAAIIHVDAEQVLLDKEAKEHVGLNENVLIEIGAAMALFGKRFILLVREGVKLPSNLQGLFEVRYSGEMLSGDATIRLLEAINDMKTHPLPATT